MKKRNKRYIPKGKHNPAVQANKIDRLGEKIEKLGKAIHAISKSHDNHISYLGNFARHDIKNAILSMDSILTATSIEEFNESKIQSLVAYLEVIRETMDNFAKLVPYSSNGKFKLESLFIAVELLTRADMQNNKVDFKLKLERTSITELEFPFQSILQMINNLIINSFKSLETVENKKIIMEGVNEHDILRIRISDNGNYIPDTNKDKIFDYGFTTTNGSGIGLYHAKYLCEQLSGDICLDLNTESEMTKTFCITLPLIRHGKDDFSNR
jgi:signal transduction histidine kinase